MLRFTTLVTAAVCGVVVAGAADAADPPGSWDAPRDFKRASPYTELVSGWYFRADLGYRKYSIESVEAPPAEPVTQYSIRNTPTLGLGGGYKYKWFRADATLDYGVHARFQGDTATTAGYYTAKIDSFTLLANVYFDLGNWGGFTPYVGVGAGTTNLRTHEYSNLTVVTGSGVEPTTRWNLSWAYMGGVSYQYSPNLVFDIGYRYLKLGDAVSGTEPTDFTTRTYFRNISAQEVRIGARWLLD